MKKNYTLLLVLFSALQSYAQQTDKPRYLKQATLLCPIDMSKSYSTKGLFEGNTTTILIKRDTVYKLKDAVLKDASGKVGAEKIKIGEVLQDTILIKGLLIEKGYAFDIVQKIGKFSIIKFWNLNEASSKNFIDGMRRKLMGAITSKEIKLLPVPINSNVDSISLDGLKAWVGVNGYDLSKNYFIIPTETLINNSIDFDNKDNAWNIGLLVMPIKIRPFATESGQFDFSGGISVGATFSWTLNYNWKTDMSYNLLAYVGTGVYTADSIKVKEPRNDYKITTFSPALGLMIAKKSVQLSALVGIDFPAGTLQKNWVYRNKPWFGVGIGFGLFNITKEDGSSSGKNK